MSAESLESDFLVIGAGMAGMTAAAFAARHGKSVIVVEKSPAIGGSALLSGGGLWCAQSYEVLRAINPLGEPEQARALTDDYLAAGAWIESLGGFITPLAPMDALMGFPSHGRTFDVSAYLSRCESEVQAAGGWIVTEATVEALLREGERVVGARIGSRDGTVEVRTPWTLLATGGFQANAALRARYIGPHAEALIVRSNPNSTGDGLTLGLSVGAALSPHMDGWYGHTIPFPLARPMQPTDYIAYAQFHLSPRAVVVDRAGRRFTDESKGYYFTAQAVSRLTPARALVLFDDELHRVDSESYGADRYEVAVRAGAHAATAASWREVARVVEAWGYPGIDTAMETFNRRVVAAPETLDPPRIRHRRPLDRGPFFAVEIQPAITFTHGGLRIDAGAHVLDARGAPIAGLLAAGADAGGTYHQAYAGGLSMSAVFGLRAARQVVSG